MSACCDHDCDPGPAAFHDDEKARAYRRVLWFALVVNAGMFGVEIAGALISGSVALQADAANYGISLAVVGMHLAWRARAALMKGLSMGAFGLWVIGTTLWRITQGGVPEAHIITSVGLAALLANVAVAAALYRYRAGDANMRSVWLCSRNDAIANVAVIAAGAGVWATGSFWPDVAVGAVIAGLALTASVDVVRRAIVELRTAKNAGRMAAAAD